MTASSSEPKVTPFTFVTAILEDGRSLLTERPDYTPAYNMFMINRALSYHQDTILPAQWMNERRDISKDMHEAFLLSVCTRRRRPFKKWAKTETDDRVSTIVQYYECSPREAVQYLDILTDEQVKLIEQSVRKGGLTTRKNK